MTIQTCGLIARLSSFRTIFRMIDQFAINALRTCLVSAESGRIVENRLRSLSCQIIQAIFLER
ncbi:hypothetical protein EFP23_13250, partial [Lacticaseibacillus paracasei]|nr:hypothetical protein [Lacticaseibacillus paracasei]